MRKVLPAPAHLAAAQPQQACIPTPAAVPAADPADPAQFVSVPLEDPAAGGAQLPGSPRSRGWLSWRQPQPVAAPARAGVAAGDSDSGALVAPPLSPGRSLLRKLSVDRDGGGGGASQGPTPRIAAVGGTGGAPSGFPAALRASSHKEGGYAQLELRAVASSTDATAA